MFYTRIYKVQARTRYHITLDQQTTLCKLDCDSWRIFEGIDPKIKELCKNCRQDIDKKIENLKVSELMKGKR